MFNKHMPELDAIYFDQHPEHQMSRLRAIMKKLRAPDGCPWDKEQTHESILPDLLEEVYECVDAIKEGDTSHMREEIGDVLLQVVFHSELAEEAQRFTFEDIVGELAEKLVRRHPHVFGELQAHTTDEVLLRWDKIKRQEHGTEKQPYLHNTGVGLPALMRAVKLQKKAGKVKFDWPNSLSVLEKIKEETTEVEETITENESYNRRQEELGDLLFAVANLCRKEGINPEIALHEANQKFERRFNQVESRLAQTSTPLGVASLEEMDSVWNDIKIDEKKQTKEL